MKRLSYTRFSLELPVHPSACCRPGPCALHHGQGVIEQLQPTGLPSSLATGVLVLVVEAPALRQRLLLLLQPDDAVAVGLHPRVAPPRATFDRPPERTPIYEYERIQLRTGFLAQEVLSGEAQLASNHSNWTARA